MKLLLDSANVEEVKKWMKTDAISGVTTNPSLVSKEQKRNYNELLAEIAGIIHSSVRTAGKASVQKKHFSVEVISLNPDEMVEQAISLYETLYRRYPNIDLHVKIPILPETMNVITYLTKEKFVHVNATAAMTWSQAKMAADAGAQVVSFFYNRMKDGFKDKEINPDNASFLANDQIRTFKCMDDKTKIICGSIRNVQDILECFVNNSVDFVTTSDKVLTEMLVHPKTTEAVNQFQKDIDTWLE